MQIDDAPPHLGAYRLCTGSPSRYLRPVRPQQTRRGIGSQGFDHPAQQRPHIGQRIGRRT
jgi:hypothetical protein